MGGLFNGFRIGSDTILKCGFESNSTLKASSQGEGCILECGFEPNSTPKSNS